MDRYSNINTLLAFVTVAREGSVSRAAQVLNLTQPAISHQIKRLSDDTGITLFTRVPSGLQITHDGAALLGKAEGVLQAMNDFHQSASKRVGRVSGTLKIGTILDPEFIRLGQLLSHLRTAYPDIQTELRHGVSGNIPVWLDRGLIDAGFFLSAPDEIPNLHTPNETPLRAARLANFTYRVIAPAGWQARIDGADWAALADLPWIGTPETSVHHRLLSKVFAQHGCTQNAVAQVDQEASMLEMVRSGIGLSLCRESIALHQKQTIGLAVSDTVTIPACLSLVTLPKNESAATVEALFGLLNRTWR
ncbi:MAG: LysR family transcriptional regulator [Rhodobacteraceae bacterium]|nr:LysR family transcriptional regulator [Paracoccaceae bacterium]